jgi:putative ribosome biogenesis GTPase RsgA
LSVIRPFRLHLSLLKHVRLRSIRFQSVSEEHRCSKQRISFLFLKNPKDSLLNRSHDDLVKRIETLLTKIQSQSNLLSVDDKKRIHEAQLSLDSIFLLVVVGEFNSGKSKFINSLLGEKEDICATGVLPTTDLIHILKFGEKREELFDNEHVKSISLPNLWLKQTNIVDTPGTNAILQSHQQITGQSCSNNRRERDILECCRTFYSSFGLYSLCHKC